jgi:hypothetical protein
MYCYLSVQLVGKSSNFLTFNILGCGIVNWSALRRSCYVNGVVHRVGIFVQAMVESNHIQWSALVSVENKLIRVVSEAP